MIRGAIMIEQKYGFRIDREVLAHVFDRPKSERETLPDGRFRVPMHVSLLSRIDEVRGWLIEQGMAFEFVQTVHFWSSRDVSQGSGSKGYPFVILGSEREVVLFMVRWR